MDHDAAHKYLYALTPVVATPVVADLLRLVVPRWVDELDLAAIEDVSAEYLDEDHRRRLGDMVWKVCFREGALANGRRPYVLVLVEFQSTADRDMARRIHEYTDLLLDRLVRNGVAKREGGLPHVLSVVVYNGSERWTAIGGDGRDGGAGHLAPVPSARAERDLAPLQPQRYRLVDENAGSEQDWPTHNTGGGDGPAAAQRSARPAAAPADGGAALPGCGARSVSPGAAFLGAGAVGTQDGCRRCISIIR